MTTEHRTAEEPAQPLTPREREILALVRAGRTNAEIADELGISRDGVRYHVKELHSKLYTEGDRAELRSRRWSLGGILAWLLTIGRPVAATAAVAGISAAGYVGVLAAQSLDDTGTDGSSHCAQLLPADEPPLCADSPSELLAAMYEREAPADPSTLPAAYCGVEFFRELAAAAPSPVARERPEREAGWGDLLCARSPAHLSRLLHENGRLADATNGLRPSAYCVELFAPGVTPQRPAAEPTYATCADTVGERYRVLEVMQARVDAVLLDELPERG